MHFNSVLYKLYLIFCSKMITKTFISFQSFNKQRVTNHAPLLLSYIHVTWSNSRQCRQSTIPGSNWIACFYHKGENVSFSKLLKMKFKQENLPPITNAPKDISTQLTHKVLYIFFFQHLIHLKHNFAQWTFIEPQWLYLSESKWAGQRNSFESHSLHKIIPGFKKRSNQFPQDLMTYLTMCYPCNHHLLLRPK